MTHTHSGSGHAGFSIDTTELYIRHDESIVLHLNNVFSNQLSYSDVQSEVPWAKDNGSGLLAIDSGIYFHWIGINYTECTSDCDFRVDVLEPIAQIIGAPTNIHSPANTRGGLITTGINVYPRQSGLEVNVVANNAIDPSFTITSFDLYTFKLV